LERFTPPRARNLQDLEEKPRPVISRRDTSKKFTSGGAKTACTRVKKV
jgi:hypothetical protein